MKALRIETGILPGDAATNLPTTEADAEKRTTGLLSMLAERFRNEQEGKRRRIRLLCARSPTLAQQQRPRFTDTRSRMRLPPGWRKFLQ